MVDWRSLVLLAALVWILEWVVATPPAMARGAPQIVENEQKPLFGTASDSLDCRRMVRAAGIRYRIPSEILAAFPWPIRLLNSRAAGICCLALDSHAQGGGQHFPNQATAVGATRDLLAQGVRNIDMG